MVVPAKAGTQLSRVCTRSKGEETQKVEIAWKIRLIEEMNPEWKDLSDQAF
jgi:predicted GIY-YIG superfamily endonuclease